MLNFNQNFEFWPTFRFLIHIVRRRISTGYRYFKLWVQWLPVTNAFTYEIGVYDVDNEKLVRSELTFDTFFEFSSVQPETNYKISVNAVSDTGYRSAASLFSLKTTPIPPKVTVSNISPTQVRINWHRLTSALSYVVTVNDADGNQVEVDFAFPSYGYKMARDSRI